MGPGKSCEPVRTDKRDWAFRLAHAYAVRRARRGLDGVHAHGVHRAQEVLRRGPAVFACNHVSWWDVFMVVLGDALFHRQGYAAMDARNLERFQFFRRLGALPLRRGNSQHVASDLEHMRKVLVEQGAALWFFPQGRQLPAHLRPVEVKPGIVYFGDVPVIPVGIHYLFLEAEVPRAYVSFGDVVGLNQPDPLAAVARGIERELNRIDEIHVNRLDAEVRVVRSRFGKPAERRGARALRLFAPDARP